MPLLSGRTILISALFCSQNDRHCEPLRSNPVHLHTPHVVDKREHFAKLTSPIKQEHTNQHQKRIPAPTAVIASAFARRSIVSLRDAPCRNTKNTKAPRRREIFQPLSWCLGALVFSSLDDPHQKQAESLRRRSQQKVDGQKPECVRRYSDSSSAIHSSNWRSVSLSSAVAAAPCPSRFQGT